MSVRINVTGDPSEPVKAIAKVKVALESLYGKTITIVVKKPN